MRLETLNGEMIFSGNVTIRSLQTLNQRDVTPNNTRYWVRVSVDGVEANYGEQIEVTEQQYNILRNDMLPE